MIEFENKELIYSSSVVLMSVEGFKNCINNWCGRDTQVDRDRLIDNNIVILASY